MLPTWQQLVITTRKLTPVKYFKTKSMVFFYFIFLHFHLLNYHEQEKYPHFQIKIKKNPANGYQRE
jgi:hypothetical protein